MRRLLCILTIGVLSLLLGSCSLRHMVVNEITAMAGKGMSAFEQDDDLNLVIKAVPANIKLFEVLLENDPKNPELLTLLARMYGSYGFVYYETRLEGLLLDVTQIDSDVDYFDHADIKHTKDILERYDLKGSEFAMRALEVRHKNARSDLANISTMDGFLQSLTRKDVPALFWYGFNLGSYINLNRDSVQALAKIHIVENIMLRVAQIDPDYFHAGAHLYLTAFYASRSPMMGGNLDAAGRHYEEVKKRAGQDYLLADVFFARFYLYQNQEREAFEKLLDGVIAAAPDRRYAMFNQVAVDRAKIYLKAIDNLFP